MCMLSTIILSIVIKWWSAPAIIGSVWYRTGTKKKNRMPLAVTSDMSDNKSGEIPFQTKHAKMNPTQSHYLWDFFFSFWHCRKQPPSIGNNRNASLLTHSLRVAIVIICIWATTQKSLLIDLTVCQFHSVETNDNPFHGESENVFSHFWYCCRFCRADKRLMSTQHASNFQARAIIQCSTCFSQSNNTLFKCSSQ